MRTIVVAVFLLLALAAPNYAQQRSYAGPFAVGKTPLEDLPEASGMASSSQPFVVWMINDSGDDPIVYAVHTRMGLLSKHSLAGAKNVDWEDIAYCKGSVYVADIGDNGAKRRNVLLYTVREPSINVSTAIPNDSVSTYELAYPDGARDAEALLVDPRTDEFVIVSKRDVRARIYSGRLNDSRKQILTFRGELPVTLVTGGSVSSDGLRILLKSYHKTWEWTRDPKEPLWKALLRNGSRVPYAPEQQGEAICYDLDNNGYYTTSEREDGGNAAPIHYYPLVKGAAAGHDMKLPQIEAVPVQGAKKKYLLRYTIPELLRVAITVHNEGMFKVKTIAEDSAESGVQEREIDLSKLPSGSYAVMLRTQQSQASCLIEIP